MANKKISELPLISALSGSQVGGTVIPVVVGGTTAQISGENFSKFMNAYAAQTGSANTFTATQTITQNLIVNGTTTIGGNATIGGALNVSGKLTAEEFHTTITTSSVLYQSGSTKFGNSSDDTHQFTGSIQIGGETLGNSGLNAFTASAGSQLSRVYQATASLQSFTASQDDRNFTLSQVTGSFRGEIGALEAYSASLKAAAIVSSSTQIQNYDVFALNSNLYNGTGSIKGEVAAIEAYTASLKSVSVISGSSQLPEIAGIEAYTASLKAAAIVSSSTQIQNYDLFALNSNLYNGTGSIKGEVAGIEAYTASLKGQAIVSSSTQVQNYDLFALNSNLYNATGSLRGITNGLMAYTSSNETWKTGVRAEINGIEAWTASLDNTYATDAQLYQLYQATRSLELLSGSMIGITNGLMAYTSSNETWKTGVSGEVSGIEAYTASLKGQAIVSSSTQVQNYDVFALNSNLYTSTGSIKGEIAGIESYTSSLKAAISVSGTNVQIIGDLNVNKLNVQYVSSSVLVTSGSNIFGDQSTDKHEFTGSVNIKDTLFINGDAIGLNGLNSSTASLIGITNGLMALTASMKSQAIVSSSTQIQNYDVFALNSNLYNGTGSIKGEIAGIEAYTASLKTSGIVSSSQQIQNYNTFAVTSSANTFYGNQTVIGSLGVGVVPTEKLHIAGASNNVFLNEATSGNYAINRLKNGSFTVDSGVDSNGMYLDGATGDFRYYSGSIERFRIGNDGKKYLGVYNGSRLQIDANGESIYSYTNTYYIFGLYNDSNNLSIESAFAGNIIFRTGAQGVSSIPTTTTERARVTNAGFLKASNNGTYNSSTGTYHELRTNVDGNYSVQIANTSTTNAFGVQVYYTSTFNDTGKRFIDCEDNTTLRFSVRSNGGIANYQSNNVDLSDERVKSDITPLGSSWNEVKQYEIVSYKYIDQTHNDANIGVIAQQIESVNPNLIDNEGWTNANGDALKTVYNKDLYFTAIKALQEAMVRIEELETKVAQLQNL